MPALPNIDSLKAALDERRPFDAAVVRQLGDDRLRVEAGRFFMRTLIEHGPTPSGLGGAARETGGRATPGYSGGTTPWFREAVAGEPGIGSVAGLVVRSGGHTARRRWFCAETGWRASFRAAVARGPVFRGVAALAPFEISSARMNGFPAHHAGSLPSVTEPRRGSPRIAGGRTTPGIYGPDLATPSGLADLVQTFPNPAT